MDSYQQHKKNEPHYYDTTDLTHAVMFDAVVHYEVSYRTKQRPASCVPAGSVQVCAQTGRVASTKKR